MMSDMTMRVRGMRRVVAEAELALARTPARARVKMLINAGRHQGRVWRGSRRLTESMKSIVAWVRVEIEEETEQGRSTMGISKERSSIPEEKS